MIDGAFEYDVFLSYSHKDKDAVHDLARRLNNDGLRVWLDSSMILPGDSIPLKIQQGLDRSRTLLMCMSPSYFESEWGQSEYDTLFFRDPTNSQRRFIPILIKNCTPPSIIAKFAYLDWRVPSNDVYHKLLAICKVKEADTVTPKKKIDQSRMTLTSHTGKVSCVAVTPDGKTIISGSMDRTLRVWDLESGEFPATFRGHRDYVSCVAVTPDGKTIVSSSFDRTLRVWDLESRKCLATFKGHTGLIRSVAVTPDGNTVISGSNHSSLRVWDLASGKCLTIFERHTGAVSCVAVTPDGKTIISGSMDRTLRVWDLASWTCFATFEGHTGAVSCVAVTPDGKTIISGSEDRTLKVWDLESRKCLATFEGHTGAVSCVAVTPDGKTIISGSMDRTLRVWDLLKSTAIIDTANNVRYTNAKVALVGKTGVGKTGLALRLCENRWEPTASTHGMSISRLELTHNKGLPNIECEIWLWDFAGQPDYRLIHQLYMDKTTLGILVFDPQDDNPFEDIGYWDKALHAANTSNKYQPARLLVAARCDRGGITISQKKFDKYIRDHGIDSFLKTAAQTGEGCEELKVAIVQHIHWDRLDDEIVTPRLFKTLKDAIFRFKQENRPLVRIAELHQWLQFLLPEETIDYGTLVTVVGLMNGQGLVQMLNFGEFVLLQPEWINHYASVIVRMAREHIDEMGVVPERQVLDGRLDYKGMNRLADADEKILLRGIVNTFVERSLCYREDTLKGTFLVFPSYFRRDKPDLPEHPSVFVTYHFSGVLDEIYATLVVRLSYSEGFKPDELWKDAADFKTPGGKRVGLVMTKKSQDTADIQVYFDVGVPEDTKVIFLKYVHEHLRNMANSVTRMRSYVCLYCNEPVTDRHAIESRLSKGYIRCQFCDKRIILKDLIEEKFDSPQAQRKIQKLDNETRINLDNESRELILDGDIRTIIGEAGQIYREVTKADKGIDGEIEFKDDNGNASGKRIYLQLKSGDSYLYRRKRDNVEVFTIKNDRHAEYWQAHAYPVMLVIRTSDGMIRWMNITEYLKRHGPNTKQIVFDAEPFTALNLTKMREKVLNERLSHIALNKEIDRVRSDDEKV